MGSETGRNKDSIKSLFAPDDNLWAEENDEDQEEEEEQSVYSMITKALGQKKKSKDEQIMEMLRED